MASPERWLTCFECFASSRRVAGLFYIVPSKLNAIPADDIMNAHTFSKKSLNGSFDDGVQLYWYPSCGFISVMVELERLWDLVYCDGKVEERSLELKGKPGPLASTCCLYSLFFLIHDLNSKDHL
jgi:hypothetical protein